MKGTSQGMLAKAAATSTRSTLVLFSYGFRPFFLLAGLYAVVPIGIVYWALTTGHWPEQAIPLFTWHGHEMLFGFVAAAIAGFLLTAVPTWTNTKAVSGLPLIILVAAWLAGRVVSSPWVPISSVVTSLLSVSFFPALAVAVAIPLTRTRNFRNWPFALLLLILFGADLAFQARRFGWIEGELVDGLRLTINLAMLMIVIVGGRIIPAFTRNALVALRRDAKIRNYRALDIASVVGVVSVMLGDLFAVEPQLTGYLAALCALLLFLRLSGWGGLRTLAIPLLWVLHVGYLWLVIALALKAFWILGGFGWAMNWMHAFTAGAFGTMILGVMTRVALGHTGRALRIPPIITVSYVLVSVAASVRVLGPWFAETHYLNVLTASIAAWIAAFLIFLVVYIPILLQPRVDGKPG